MTKKDKEGLEEAVALLQEANAMLSTLYERLYVRTGDAWQFKSKVDELARKSSELQEKYSPEPEPTVGFDEEEFEVDGLA